MVNRIIIEVFPKKDYNVTISYIYKEKLKIVVYGLFWPRFLI